MLSGQYNMDANVNKTSSYYWPLYYAYNQPPKHRLTVCTHGIESFQSRVYNIHAWTFNATTLELSLNAAICSLFLFSIHPCTGGSHVIMGVAGLTALAIETLTYFLLPRLSMCFGYRSMMFCGLLLVSVRYFIYGMVRNPWWLVVPETFKGR